MKKTICLIVLLFMVVNIYAGVKYTVEISTTTDAYLKEYWREETSQEIVNISAIMGKYFEMLGNVYLNNKLIEEFKTKTIDEKKSILEK